MKYIYQIFLFLLLLLSSSIFATTPHADQIVVVLMVKNEALVLEKTLDPLVFGGLTNFFIYDTCSDDETTKIAQQYFESHNIKEYKIIEEPFINFGESRTKALRYAETFFPDAQFMLMLDAEWYMDNVATMVSFCASENDDAVDLYLIRIIGGQDEFYVPRLIKTKRNISFSGKIHEAPIVSCSRMLDPLICFRYEPTKYGREKTGQRFKRDLSILQEEYENDPTSPRTTFYLAQTYDSLCQFEDAFKFYKLRTELHGSDEENFMAWYRCGKMASILYQQTSDEDWLARAIQSYETAWQKRLSRIEPAVALAELHIREGTMQLAYLILKEVFDYDYPKDDFLFIEGDKYHFKRYELLSICAWYVGDYALGKKAALKALQHNRELSYLHRNLALYVMKLEE